MGKKRNSDNNFDKRYDAMRYDDDYYSGRERARQDDGRRESYDNNRSTRENNGNFAYVPPKSSAEPINYTAGDVVVSTPKSYKEVQSLIDRLKNNQPIIVDVAQLKPEHIQRYLDFLSGAVYALSGSEKRIAKTIYVLTPRGCSIQIPYEIQQKIDRETK